MNSNTLCAELGLQKVCSSFSFCFVGCLDVLTMAQQANLTVVEETKEKQTTCKVYTKDDFTVVNRFESMSRCSLHQCITVTN